MAISEKKKKTNARWDNKNLERVSLVVRKGDKDVIRARADALGKPINRYINDLIRADIESAGK